MCGRYAHAGIEWESLLPFFPGLRVDTGAEAFYNIAPTMSIPVVLNDGEGPRLRMVRWGLVPHWCDDIKFGNRTFNARAETLAEKPSFRDSFKRRRCLIPASGYFEWKREEGGRKTPYFIRLRGGRQFAFAGLWASNTRCEPGEVCSATIVTCEPNAICGEIHHRMPVILRPESYRTWVDPELTDTAVLEPLLVPYPGEDMECLRGTNPQDAQQRARELFS